MKYIISRSSSLLAAQFWIHFLCSEQWYAKLRLFWKLIWHQSIATILCCPKNPSNPRVLCPTSSASQTSWRRLAELREAMNWWPSTWVKGLICFVVKGEIQRRPMETPRSFFWHWHCLSQLPSCSGFLGIPIAMWQETASIWKWSITNFYLIQTCPIFLNINVPWRTEQCLGFCDMYFCWFVIALRVSFFQPPALSSGCTFTTLILDWVQTGRLSGWVLEQVVVVVSEGLLSNPLHNCKQAICLPNKVDDKLHCR